MPRLKASERPRRDDARERRILTDDELGYVLAAAGERDKLYFRTVAETGARMGEGLGITRRRGDQRRAALEARYDGGMATDTPQHTATSGSADVVEMTAVQAVRDRVG
jgi:integrase